MRVRNTWEAEIFEAERLRTSRVDITRARLTFIMKIIVYVKVKVLLYEIAVRKLVHCLFICAWLHYFTDCLRNRRWNSSHLLIFPSKSFRRTWQRPQLHWPLFQLSQSPGFCSQSPSRDIPPESAQGWATQRFLRLRLFDSSHRQWR